jgi:hypothetical protein
MLLISAYTDFPFSMGLCTMLTILAACLLVLLRHRVSTSRGQLAIPLGGAGRKPLVQQNRVHVIVEGNPPVDRGQADLRGLHLEEARLGQADLSQANLEGTLLVRASLSGATLQGANLEAADLSGAFLDRANLRFANLRRAILRKADLTGACLRETQLDEADLSGADMTRTSLGGAFFKGAALLGVSLSDAQLQEIATLYQARLDAELLARVARDYPHLLIDPVELFWKHHKMRLATMLNARRGRAARPFAPERGTVPVQGI